MPSSLNNSRLGIISILIGMIAMSLMDVMIKLLSDAYPLHEIILVRSLVGIAVISIIIYYEGSFGLLRTKRIYAHISRGLLFVSANMTFYLALSQMPLAEVVAIFFISPVLITALSVIILKESVGWHRWGAVLIGFFGVAVMMRLGSDSYNLMSILPLIAAFAYSLSHIITRKIGLTEKTSVMSFYSIVVFIVVSVIFGIVTGDGSYSGVYGPSVEFVFRPWVLPNMMDSAQMFGIGLLMAIVAYMVTQAYRVADLNVVAPFEYISLPLGVIWGYVFLSEIPDTNTFIGITLIAGSGLYVLYREQRANKKKAIIKGSL